MHLLFVCYWGLADGLTQATALPHVRLLLASPKVQSVILVTIERTAVGGNLAGLDANNKFRHVALRSRNLKGNLLNKANDFLYFPRLLRALCTENKIDRVIARGAPAGALVYPVCRRLNLPLYVESFEPHADYMRYAGVWKPWDPRYLFQQRAERKVARYAQGLMPVAHNYAAVLEQQGIAADKIYPVPCSVDLDVFYPDGAAGKAMRLQLGLPENALLGVYVGKFGDLYYQQEAYRLFAALQADSRFFLLVLTPQDAALLRAAMQHAGVLPERLLIRQVAHAEVPLYLQAAHFAFCLHRSTPVSPYFSPIKIGEYWACGLPVIITEQVGDDAVLIRDHQLGCVLPQDWPDRPAAFFRPLLQQVLQCRDAVHIRQQAQRFRSRDICRQAYQHFQLL